MKSTDYYEHQGQQKSRKRFWVPLLVALPAAALVLIAVPLGLRFFSGSFGEPGLKGIYSYRFERPSPGSVTIALEREITFYQKRISQDPEDWLNQAALGGAYLKMARATGETSWYLLAEQTAQESLAKMPFQNDAAILVLARVATARHDFAQAISLTNQASKNEDSLSIGATANLAMGKVDEANQAANALVDRIPTLGSLTLRALVKVAQGNDREAIQDFQQAIAAEEPEETGSSVWARTLLGRLYFKRGQLKLAEGLYKEALRVLPQYPPALLNLAELKVRLGDYKAAENLYSQFFLTLQKAPTVYDHVVMRGMARVKDLSGDPSEAQKWRERAEDRLRNDMTTFGHKRELARLLLERGRSQDVVEALSLMQAEVHIRQDAETYDTLAWALSSLGRWGEAQKAMQEGLRSGIRDPAMFYRAGIIEQKLGNQKQALAFFKLVQQSDPTFDENARKALGLGVGLLGLN
ncbi:MAG: tetratricopeptide repeat protein [Aphanothece sp. CMT-3BRIN-NPC111]|jgi:tetratricopeptide (TPR) repeat protein|nr:tetratricopeptide repeat protein [Aphanothece sp. CMT-3BRIN-NPC111]